MTIEDKTKRASRGSVNIRPKNGRLEIYFTYQGKKRYLSGGADTPVNWRAAEVKARQIELDIVSGNFDPTLKKYKPEAAAQEEEKVSLLTPQSLWKKYANHLASHVKPTTQGYHASFDALFAKVGNISVVKAEKVKEALLEVTTPHQTKRALSKLSAACDWAKQKGILKENPYDGMAKELPKFRYQVDPKPNAFTEEEVQQILDAFRSDSRAGTNYRHYASLVEFWFLTGCRPSEAIGLQWKHVTVDFKHISFEGSVTTSGGKSPIRVEGSKNNKKRRFPCSTRLQDLLKSIKPESPDPEELVFPAPKGGVIHYNNFCNKAWNAIVDPIKPGTTPYSCRDTFITTQIIKGVPESVVAYWCDTSVGVIEKSYADFIKMTQFTPQDFTVTPS